ncbi:MAG TPA: hypothetical protein VFS94_02165 [Gemmatimonadales bacterium]|nr:hypothetical protein [Gemmatimonadales bacterium]
MDDTPLDPELTRLAAEYHEPPPPPRDQMWQRIAAARRRPTRTIEFRRIARVALPMAAVLALAFAMGRWTASGDTAANDSAVAMVNLANDSAATGSMVYRAAATRHLRSAGTYLAEFRDAALRDETSPAAGSARELLVSNRLLLSSPAAEDPQIRNLLEDVELLLVQIAQLPAEGVRADTSLITDGLDAVNLLTRIRAEVTPGPAARPQGVI